MCSPRTLFLSLFWFRYLEMTLTPSSDEKTASLNSKFLSLYVEGQAEVAEMALASVEARRGH